MEHRLWLLRILLSVALVLHFSNAFECAATPLSSENDLSTQIDSLFSEWNHPDLPGFAIAVVRDGKMIHQRGYGSANLEYGIQIQPDTIFHVASVSKQFTAMAILLLAKEGKLSLDDDIRKHLPEVPDFGKTITIRHLAHHTSGLRDQWTLLSIGGWRMDDVITRDHIMKLVSASRELNFNPGEEHAYSNTGYTLMAEIVERVSGQPFAEWCRLNIFEPLGMSKTHIHSDHEMLVKNRAYSYRNVGGQWKHSPLNFANQGATSLFTTAKDLAKWLANFTTAEVGGESVIHQMQQNGVLNTGKEIDYAWGMEPEKMGSFSLIGHSGVDAGYRADVIFFPKEKLGVVVLANFASALPWEKSRQVAALCLMPATNAVASSSGFGIPPEEISRSEGQFVMANGLVANFVHENGQWFMRAGNFEAALRCQSRDTFLVSGLYPLFAERDQHGYLTKIWRGTNAQGKVYATRFAPEQLDQSKLQTFVGDYYSPEVDTFYRIRLKDGILRAEHARHPDITLFPKSDGSFVTDQWFFGEVRFGNEGGGKPKEFLISNPRVKNLRFIRVRSTPRPHSPEITGDDPPKKTETALQE